MRVVPFCTCVKRRLLKACSRSRYDCCSVCSYHLFVIIADITDLSTEFIRYFISLFVSIIPELLSILLFIWWQCIHRYFSKYIHYTNILWTFFLAVQYSSFWSELGKLYMLLQINIPVSEVTLVSFKCCLK